MVIIDDDADDDDEGNESEEVGWGPLEKGRRSSLAAVVIDEGMNDVVLPVEDRRWALETKK